MNPNTRKLRATLAAIALAVAALTAVATGLLAQDRGEDTLVAQTVEEVQRLLRHEAYRLEGPQALPHAQAAVAALAASPFDVVQIYTTAGLLMAEQFSEDGRRLLRDGDLPAMGVAAARSYTQPWFERRLLPGRRALQRVFVPVRAADQQLVAYLEAARLVPEWQQQRLAADARRVALWSALGVLAVAMALYPALRRLHAQDQQRQRELLESHIAMMEALGRAIARCDSDSDSHNFRVAWIAASLAEAVGLHGTRMQELIVGSFLHDVGKIGVPDHILLKPGPLSEEEKRIMRTHVGIGEDIVSGAGWLGGGQAVVAGHHEKWDGSGYPRGLAGTDIPLVARIFAIADVFDNLCSRRPYKEPLSLETALQELRAGAGRHFDPHLVQVFERLAASIYRTITDSSEEQLRELLERMVRKHFAL